MSAIKVRMTLFVQFAQKNAQEKLEIGRYIYKFYILFTLKCKVKNDLMIVEIKNAKNISHKDLRKIWIKSQFGGKSRIAIEVLRIDCWNCMNMKNIIKGLKIDIYFFELFFLTFSNLFFHRKSLSLNDFNQRIWKKIKSLISWVPCICQVFAK